MHTPTSIDEYSTWVRMPQSQTSYLNILAEAGQEVIRGNYRAATHMLEVTRGGSCPKKVGDLAEVLESVIVKTRAREEALDNALADLGRKTVALEEAGRLRAEFGKLFIGTILALCCYATLVSFLRDFRQISAPVASATHLVNLGLFGILGGLMTWFLHEHRYSLNTFGLTWRNGRRSLIESLLACIPVLGLLVMFKVVLVHVDPSYRGQPLIEPTLGSFPWQTFVLYLPVCICQEFSTRGVLQTCIERVLEGKKRATLAILLGAINFGVLHLHYSFQLSVLAFFAGLLFGSLYLRHRTIVGITIAHYLLGVCVFGPLQLVR